MGQALAPKAPTNQNFWKAVIDRFGGSPGVPGLVATLSEASKRSLETVLSANDGPVFVGKDALISVLSNGPLSQEKLQQILPEAKALPPVQPSKVEKRPEKVPPAEQSEKAEKNGEKREPQEKKKRDTSGDRSDDKPRRGKERRSSRGRKDSSS